MRIKMLINQRGNRPHGGGGEKGGDDVEVTILYFAHCVRILLADARFLNDKEVEFAASRSEKILVGGSLGFNTF